MSPKQAAFIHASLLQVQRALAERGIELHYQACHAFSDSIDALLQFCAKQQVDQLFYNYQYEVNERQRDAEAEKRLDESGRDLPGL
ncbi:Deoxyribodipyrimidine photo-lyase [Pantoea agglomerans]|uniref:Deoxyribodipyrimidine photo-lyase n=1 Tax=Enterobacter agglomerans TaxID=549 RepID=A0A379AJ59_ENTAG|nr:Deoxyribodipyrimidine photo-lyase [Pantoea agglomerans]